MRSILAVGALLVVTTGAYAGFRYSSAPSVRWGLSDPAVGVGNCTIENFEDATLAPGLRVAVTTGNGSYGPTSTLPAAFDTSVDAFGSAFLNSQWDGTHALVNTSTNQTKFYNDANNWGDVELVFDPPVKVVAFSLYQREVAARLVVNGVDRGELGSLTGVPTSGTRGGYAIITATGSDTISSVKIDNQNGDGMVFDHVAFSAVASPEPVITGTTGWQQTDSALGVHNAAIESFESLSLNPRLSVLWEAPAGSVGPTSTLPVLFNPVTDDPFGNAFDLGVWDGTHGLISGRGNRTYNYLDGPNWGDLAMSFDPPLAVFGVSMQQTDGEIQLVVNGRDVGRLSAYLPLSGGRNGYLRMETPGEAIITSVRFNNTRTATTGDGTLFDHLAMKGCGSDFNNDGQVDFFDYLDFAAAFDAEDAAADFNGDGQVDFFDYLDFAAAFDSGC
jgi:hypothetical protein